MISSSDILNQKVSSYKEKIRGQLKKKLQGIKLERNARNPSSDFTDATPNLRQEISQVDFTHIYRTEERLGEGAHALVHRVVRISDNAEFAAKIFRTSDPEIITTIRKSYYICQLLSHPNLLEVKELFINEQNGHIYQIMELCRYPSLEQQMERISEQEAKVVIKGILEGLEYMHRLGVCHRDLKPDNILFNGSRVKIIDLGVSKRFVVKKKQIEMWTSTGTTPYCAPEIFKGVGYTYKIDVWAVGVILYQCLTKKLPFHDETVCGTIDLICGANIPDHPALKGQVVRDLIARLLNREPKSRLSANDALKHPWFDQNAAKSESKDDSGVHEGLQNTSHLQEGVMSQSTQREDTFRTKNGEKIQAFTQTVHVKQQQQQF